MTTFAFDYQNTAAELPQTISFEITHRFESEKHDIRRRRKYYRELKLALEIRISNSDNIENMVMQRRHSLMGEIMDAFRAVMKYEHFTRANIPYHFDSKAIWMAVVVPYIADKPSEIWSEDECKELFIEAIGGSVEDKLQSIITAALDKINANYLRENQVADANMALSHYSNILVKRAREATRYKQRLAALKAELDAEIAAQLASFRETEAVEQDTWVIQGDDGNRSLSNKAISLVLDNLSDSCQRLSADKLTGFPRSGSKTLITEKDFDHA